MKRGLLLFLVLLFALSFSGCNFLKRVVSHCRNVTVTLENGTITTQVQCSLGASGLAGEAAPSAVSALDESIARGAVVSDFDECRDFCGNPESDACDQCRSTVGTAITQPYYNACQGSAYQPLPPQVNVILRVDTNVGQRQSPVFTAFKDRGTVRYDGCGGENSDFVLPDTQVQPWARSLVSQGVRRVNRAQIVRVGPGGAEIPFVQLKEGLQYPDESAGPMDPSVWGLGLSGWIFNNGTDGDDDNINADGLVTPLLLPNTPSGIGGGRAFVGEGTLSLKPCNSDGDCLGSTACADDGYCRAR